MGGGWWGFDSRTHRGGSCITCLRCCSTHFLPLYSLFLAWVHSPTVIYPSDVCASHSCVTYDITNIDVLTLFIVVAGLTQRQRRHPNQSALTDRAPFRLASMTKCEEKRTRTLCRFLHAASYGRHISYTQPIMELEDGWIDACKLIYIYSGSPADLHVLSRIFLFP